MSHRYPKRNDQVIDRMGKIERRGVVIGSTYVNEERFVKVLFNNSDEPEELEEGSFFTQDNCGYGRWDDKLQSWVMENSEDSLPDDDPFVIAFNKQIEEMNLRLLKERLGPDWHLNLLQLETLAIENEMEAARIGRKDQFSNFYRRKSEDYRKAIEYRINAA